MTRTVSLEQLNDFLSDNRRKIDAVGREVEEIQVGFNSAYVEFKADHDAQLASLTETLFEKLDSIGPELRDRIDGRAVEERRLLAERRTELRENLIPQTQAEADAVLAQAQEQTKALRQLNPRLDEREELYKTQQAALETKLAQLNSEISQRSRGLGFITHFISVAKLDRQRHRILGQLETLAHNLKEVREEWQASQQEFQAGQEALQGQWRDLSLRAAELKRELAYLDDDAQRESLAVKRAVRHTLDNLKEPVSCPRNLRAGLEAMIELNVKTDAYQEGLGTVGGLIALLDSVGKGMDSFQESVGGLIGEQRMHSEFLPGLKLRLPDSAIAFHKQWDGLRAKMRDDARLCAHPAEFLEAARPVIQRDLSNEAVTGMFNSLGQALTEATEKWRG
jgi:predicted  nucleic acid-binding Zn-ribbon protein